MNLRAITTPGRFAGALLALFLVISFGIISIGPEHATCPLFLFWFRAGWLGVPLSAIFFLGPLLLVCAFRTDRRMEPLMGVLAWLVMVVTLLLFLAFLGLAEAFFDGPDPKLFQKTWTSAIPFIVASLAWLVRLRWLAHNS